MEASVGSDEAGSDGSVNPQGTQLNKSPGNASNMSGTTANISYPVLEFADMESEQMISKLTDLSDAAGRMIDLLAPRNVSSLDLDKLSRDIQDPTTRRAKNFRAFKSAFDEVRRVYGDEPYICLSIVICIILKIEHPAEMGEGVWRPDDVFYKANLVTFLEGLQIQKGSLDDTRLPLEKMDRDFPDPFLARLAGITSQQTRGSSSLLKDTFELALDIRTHFTLQALKDRVGDANFDPSIILNQVFYETHRPTSIRDWGVDGLRQADLKKEKRNAIVGRMQLIQSYFRHDFEAVKNKSTVDIEGLYAKFPLPDFIRKVLSWIRRRGDEIEKSLLDVGHTFELQENLDAEIKRRETLEPAKSPAASNKFHDTAQISGMIAPAPPSKSRQEPSSRKSNSS